MYGMSHRVYAIHTCDRDDDDDGYDNDRQNNFAHYLIHLASICCHRD